jgi:hypothetical protein
LTLSTPEAAPPAQGGSIEVLPADERCGSKRAILAWCFFDWANSAFPTVVQTFLFSAYFTSHVAADTEAGTAAWGRATGLAALVIALLNSLAFHFTVYGRVREWDHAPVPPRRVRTAAALSLALWTVVVVSGRLLAYTFF